MKYFDNIPLVPGHIPPDVDSEEEEGDFGPPDPPDIGDDEGDGGGAAGSSRTSPTDPLECFIQELDDLASMDGPDISAALADLPVPQRGDVPTMSMQEAVEVCCVTYYIICYIVCDMCLPRRDMCRLQGKKSALLSPRASVS